MSIRILGTIAVVLVSGCAASEAPIDDATSSTADELTTAPRCPAAPPRNGSSCEKNLTACSWGDDARFGCRTQALCTDRHGPKVWEIATADCPEPAPSCPLHAPPTASSANELACGDRDLGLTCVYADKAYTCTPCSGTLCFQYNTWSVTELAPGCPSSVPNLGEACGAPKLWCDYNGCADDQIPPNQWAYGIGMRCEHGQWQPYDGHMACL